MDNKNWFKLDNAAKIYPAAKSNNWTAIFRVSACLNEQIDPDTLREAQRSALRRFPTFCMRLRRGAFWYYFEKLDGEPEIQPDVANPCVRMDFRENGGFMFRTRYHDDRIAVEIFHVLSDGTGGMAFLCTLVAEYLRLRHGTVIPRGDRVLDCSQPVDPAQLEDSFIKYARSATMSRKERAAYRIEGTPEEKHFLNIITGILPSDAVAAKAREYGGTVTEFLTAELILSICRVQQKEISGFRRRRPVKVSVPVNLRRYYPSRTLRNFASYVNPGIDPSLGEYTLEETVRYVHHFMGLETTEKAMNARFTTNVASERNFLLRVAPLVLKDPIMKAAFIITGDRLSSTTLSNLGNVKLPDEMAKYVTRLDFQLGALSYNPVTAACISYNNVMCLNFTRTIKEAEVERNFFTSLVKLGIPVKIESNRRY